MKFEPMKAVYCYFFPEVRDIIHEVEKKIPDDIYMVTASIEQVQQSLDSLFCPALELPENDGIIDLDMIHYPIIDRIVKVYSDTIPGLGKFANKYPTSGSSEGLFHILTKLKVNGVESINILDGEYEGYQAQATNLGMKTIIHNEINAMKSEPGYWFISNPSARDGNIISNEFVNELANIGNKIILDFAYVGATKPQVYDVGHKNIEALVISFSKPYGVFRSRIGGFAFTKDEVPSLYGNKWFKDTLRLFQALKLAEDIGPSGLYNKYRPIQKDIINQINKNFSLDMKTSDSYLLGYMRKKDTLHLNREQSLLIKQFERGDNYRFCLTPYFENIERGIEK
ncbi:MAG: hypothetical protein KJ583_01885 [Nanoarchaeota archaeon]|nr:hypothetical protein [Nanoarchaeota archaeon]MBU1269952.1 hypothetical protein [Nanoarchaeota archaeon]MBU1604043.1 hypothetical protein [Nanoarchaeota archaeon]MBU2442546.1 hypothetical protein [Nanoarchaeota archaeon]